MSRASDPKQRRVITSPFHSREEWGEWIDVNATPSRPDDLPVIGGQTGPRHRATHDELIAFIEANGLDQPERWAIRKHRRSTPARSSKPCSTTMSSSCSSAGAPPRDTVPPDPSWISISVPPETTRT